MTHPIPFAIDDLVVCDNANWLSSFAPDAMGLPQVNARLGQRFGAWPVISGLDRPGRKLTMTTIFGDTLTPAQREAARLVLMKKVNYEREELKRLTAANWMIPGVAPSSVLLAVGPWDVARSGSTYAPRNLMDMDDVATVAGGVIWIPGQFGKALQIAVETTNSINNPSFEIDVTNWTTTNATLTRVTTDAYIGLACGKVVTSAVNGYIYASATYLTVANNGYATAHARIKVASAGIIKIIPVGGAPVATEIFSADANNWQWVTCTWQNTTGSPVGNITILLEFATNGSINYIDACQLEANAYATSYCDGTLGPGHSWSGIAHASTSARTAASCKFTNPLLTPAGSVCMWWKPSTNETCPSACFFSEGNIKAYFNSADDKIYFTFDGTNLISTAALTFNAQTWMHLVFTWSAGMLAIYLNGVSAATGGPYTAPTLGSYLFFGTNTSSTTQVNGGLDGVLALGVALTATQVAALYANSLAADWKARWLNVKCEACQPLQNSNQGLVSTFAVDKEVRWRSRDGVQFWRVIAATGSFVVNNDGDDDAYPVIYIMPKTAKTGNVWSYKRWIPVKWVAGTAATSYPTDICNDGFDTQTLVTASKMQADGDDLRVKVDGVEVARWLDGINTTTTKVWCNLNFLASQTATMAAIGDTTGTTLTSTTDITNWPSTGILYIDTEAITYTGKSVANKQFTGCTRGAKGTTAATHAASATAYWIQHDIWILYGNAGASAPTVDDNYKPAFELDHSTNTSWVYEVFGEDDGLRSASWIEIDGILGGTFHYTANHFTNSDPWSEMGAVVEYVVIGYLVTVAHWQLYNPCGITAANYQNCEGKCDVNSTVFQAVLKSSTDGVTFTTDYTVPIARDASWHNWSQNDTTPISGTKYVRFDTQVQGGGMNPVYCYCEVGDVTITLDSTYTPTTAIGAEQTSYELAVTLTNTTTGEAITVTLTMQISQTLEIDTGGRSVILLADNSNQRQALDEVGGARQDWLRLVTGNNTLTWSDTGTVSVEVEILFDRRYIE